MLQPFSMIFFENFVRAGRDITVYLVARHPPHRSAPTHTCASSSFHKKTRTVLLPVNSLCLRGFVRASPSRQTSTTQESGITANGCMFHAYNDRMPLQKSGRSSGRRLLTKCRSTTTEASSKSAPAFTRSSLIPGDPVTRTPS